MKLTTEGIAVIEGDNYLSAEIIAERRLDVASARDLMEKYRQYIPVGGVVVDVGASLGDTAAVFAEMVGAEGRVYAFEPNPITFEALQHNMEPYPNVTIYERGLGSYDSFNADIIQDTNNIGASRLIPIPTGSQVGPILCWRLDSRVYLTRSDEDRLSFLKIDAEGWEPLILDGARETINRFRPAMLIEVNTWPLGKMGFTPADIWKRLDALGYHYEKFDGPYGDVLALPKENSHA